MQQMTPRELDHCMAHTRIACFSKPSLAPFLTALVRCPCKAGIPRHRLAIPQLAREHLLHEHIGGLDTDPDNASQKAHHRIAPSSGRLFQTLGACRLDLLDLLLDEAHSLGQPGRVCPISGHRSPSPTADRSYNRYAYLRNHTVT